MKWFRCLVIPSLLCAVLFSGGCEPSQPKNTAAKVPAQATAPTVKPVEFEATVILSRPQSRRLQALPIL